MAENSTDGIISGEWDFDWVILEQFGEELSFLSYIRKSYPFLCVIFFLFLRMFVFIVV
jgi:hypothetical protein